MTFIELTEANEAVLEFSEKDATKLVFEEIAILVEWAEAQDIDICTDLTLQELLNLYRITYNYGDWEQWFEESPIAAVEAYNSAVDESKKMIGKIH